MRARLLTLAVAATLTVAAATLTPNAAFAAPGDTWIDGKRHHQVMWDSGVPWLIGGTKIEGTCPDSHPYLDGKIGTPDRLVGQGFKVEGQVAVLEDAGYRSFKAIPAGVNKGRLAVKDTRLNGTNFIPFSTQHLYVERVCTSDPNDAWIP